MENNNDNKYVRKDIEGGYLYNMGEINYYKELQRADIVDNLMLGEYNKNGNYVMEEGLIKQLVGLAKIYQYSFGSTMFCESSVPIGEYGKLNFAIKISNNVPSEGSTTAVLELLEPIDKANGYYQNTNTVDIDTFVALGSNSFVVDALSRFNVFSKKDSGLQKKEITQQVDMIVSKKQQLSAIKTYSEPLFENQYKILFDKKIKLLSKSKVGGKILEEFGKENYKVNGWFIKEGDPNYYRYLNQILDSIIEIHKEELSKDVKTDLLLSNANKEYAKNAAALNENIVKKYNNENKNDVKEELMAYFNKDDAAERENAPEKASQNAAETAKNSGMAEQKVSEQANKKSPNKHNGKDKEKIIENKDMEKIIENKDMEKIINEEMEL